MNTHMVDVLFVYFSNKQMSSMHNFKKCHNSSPPLGGGGGDGGGTPLRGRGRPVPGDSGVMTIRERVYRVFEQVSFVIDA